MKGMMIARTLMIAAISFTFIYSTCLGLITPQQISTKQKFQRAGIDGAVIFVDVENVRGKSGFELTHNNIIDGVSVWAKEYNLQNQVSLIVDHGSTPSGYYLKEKGLSVIFAGKQMKADDVIVRDVPFCQKELLRDLVVVTADTELVHRCKRAAERSSSSSSVKSKKLQIVDPNFFLQDLERVVGNTLEKEEKKHLEQQKQQQQQKHNDEMTSNMESEIMLGARLIAVETQLKNRDKRKKNMSPKKRRKLEKQASKMRAMLGLSGPSTLQRVTSIISNNGVSNSSKDDDDGDEDNLDSAKQMDLLKKWESIRKSSGRREMTGDRVLLAEGLRRELAKKVADDTMATSFEEMEAVEAHACYANTLIRDHLSDFVMKEEEQQSFVTESSCFDFDGKDTLRLVVISDTHGCERTLTTGDFEPWLLTRNASDDDDDDGTIAADAKINGYSTNNNGLLPGGDILLHLGDFAVDRGGKARQNALERFDRWLSLQPHPVKIVVRGNHDPHQLQFSMSKATYVSKPTTMTFGDKVIAIVPYGSSSVSYSKAKRSSYLLPATCDVLATHEPPHNILDKCLSGDRAGSHTIRSAVENMKGLPPKLWVCGHIHEGRGSYRHTFGHKHTTRETIVVNTANANPGRANQISNGPVVIDVSDKHGIVDSKERKQARQKTSPIKQKHEKREDEEELLLAIDLGLRCGASLFDSSGKLLRYEQLRFEDVEELYERVPLLIDSWEENANSKIESEPQNPEEKKRVMSYIAIEGGGDLLDAWESSISDKGKNNIQLVNVRPEEWRAHLLLQKERMSGQSSKEAARLIARQVVSEFGSMGHHEGKFKTDAAESVVMGYYMANHLGWINRKPLVSRYSNGKIVVPK